MRTVAVAVVTAVGGLALAVPAGADEPAVTAPSAADHRGLQRALDDLVAGGAPGALLFTYDRGHVTALQSGVADVDAGTPMGQQARYLIGSITKTYVSTAVLQLVARGRAHLDDAASRSLPGLLAGEARITIRQLHDHTSGLPDFDTDPRGLAPYLEGDLGHVWTPRRLVRFALTKDPVASPGTRGHRVVHPGHPGPGGAPAAAQRLGLRLLTESPAPVTCGGWCRSDRHHPSPVPAPPAPCSARPAAGGGVGGWGGRPAVRARAMTIGRVRGRLEGRRHDWCTGGTGLADVERS